MDKVQHSFAVIKYLPLSLSLHHKVAELLAGDIKNADGFLWLPALQPP